MDYKQMCQNWIKSDELSVSQKQRLRELDDNQMKEMFWADLDFGTAGMRGELDLGINRMNEFMVKRATKGFSDYVLSVSEEAKNRGIVVAYDTRRFSTEFAIEVAKVFSANGIKVYLFEDVRPVPLCSFAIRHFNAFGGVIITASHNPKIYNGYKVYGDDGAQLSLDGTQKVVEFIVQTPYFGIETANLSITASDIKGKDNYDFDDFITVVGEDVDKAYYTEIQKQALSSDAVKEFGKDIKIVYTPIHGSGYKPVCSILDIMGINVNVVEEQAQPDTEFSTVRVPNPEEQDTLSMGIQLADSIGSDVVIGTDPDADRMGIAIRNDKSKFILLNGNQIGVLLVDYILKRKKEEGILPKNGAIVKTIVTTELATRIADSYGVKTFDVLTGFKFIGEKIKEWETTYEYEYLFGFEESFGSLVGTHARDKDAVVASMMFCEMICYYTKQKKIIYDVLQDIYKKHGYFVEKAISIAFGGVDGMQKMKDIMLAIRTTKFDIIAGEKVDFVSDFVSGKITYLNGNVEDIKLPNTNAIKITLKNGDWICVRPSGTEPKLKIYVATSSPSSELSIQKSEEYLQFMRKIAQ